MPTLFQTYLKKAQLNFKSGLTVGLVSIPLSISLALASGASPVIGVLSAFWGGATAALFAGSAYNIIGPTGALSGLILSFTLAHGLGFTPLLAILAGLLILVAWALNFQKYLIYIPGAVIHGFTLGVAFIIGLGQMNNAFSLKPAEVHESLLLNIIESVTLLPQTQWASAVVFGVGLIFLILAKKRWPKIPGPIVLAGLGMLLGFAATNRMIPIEIPTLYSKFGSLSLSLIPHQLPSVAFKTDVFQAASMIAFIAIIETMLSAKVADLMTKTRFNERKEMLALGLANVVSGLMGGIPVTAALARTSLNIKSGGNSRMSGVISAVAIGIISIALFGLFQYLPLPIIAAILVNVAINMVEHEHFLFLFQHDKLSFGVALVVGIVTAAADPIVAVGFGSIVMLLRQIQRLSLGDYEILVNKNKKLTHRITGEDLRKLEEGGDPLVYSFNTDLTYLNSEAHKVRLEQMANQAKNVILRFRSVSYIDPDGILMVEEIIELLERRKAQVYLVGLSTQLDQAFQKTPALRHFITDQRVFEKTADALEVIYQQK